ncbi:hypothetical protein PUV47_06055 [Pseudovibrio exalbescens]|uniref:hypothetical protein n=1 Tax=Pseudovibrio exalbescens TaxID=197461 RepID=UPI0023659E73|nr:hypothetical protein [Pseudovibrio exalbescens]MDD7909473.1 hypothetical protein [Pseudovibrio exalbescens]
MKRVPAVQYSLFRSNQSGGRAARVSELLSAGDRFRYWEGKSGQRYLFSKIKEQELLDYPGSVVLMADERMDHVVVWLGHADQHGELHGAHSVPKRRRQMAFYVHLLCTTDEERKETLSDLQAGLFSE